MRIFTKKEQADFLERLNHVDFNNVVDAVRPIQNCVPMTPEELYNAVLMSKSISVRFQGELHKASVGYVLGVNSEYLFPVSREDVLVMLESHNKDCFKNGYFNAFLNKDLHLILG